MLKFLIAKCQQNIFAKNY